MIPSLRKLIQSLLAPAGAAGDPPVSIELATAVLLVEAMRADKDLQLEERTAILQILQRRFALDNADVEELLALGERQSRAANDFFAFTSVLNERLPQEDKVHLVEQMWHVAYADGTADAGESHIISKVAGLLHVPHGDYIAAKMRAKDAAGLGGA